MSHCHYTPSRRLMSMAELNHNKTLNIRLADHLRSLSVEYDDHRLFAQSERARHCSTFWNGFYCASCGKYHHMHTTGCRNRLCPICATRTARVTAIQAVEAVAKIKEKYPECKMSLLTLTQRNIAGPDLASEVSKMLDGWTYLINRAPMRRLIGWARTIEIVPALNPTLYHPHIHAILVHHPFNSCPSITWIQAAWMEGMHLDYNPVCDLRPIEDEQGAVFEVSKYVSKMTRVYDNSPYEHDHVRYMSEAMQSRRLRSYGGEWRRARIELNVTDAELLDDDALDEYGEITDLSGACPTCNSATIPVCLRWSGLRYVNVPDDVRVIPMDDLCGRNVWKDSSSTP